MVVVLLEYDASDICDLFLRYVIDGPYASEIISYMPCVNELVAAVSQEPSVVVPLRIAVSKLLQLYEKFKFPAELFLRFPLE